MTKVIKEIKPLGLIWEATDPFLMCVFHNDAYPAGNGNLGPKSSLAGRNLGNDLMGKDGWRMYFGQTVPGFPAHPHRGFETITIVTKGWVDHSDSMGASGRYGKGDVQWMTAGKGMQHSEMFPLVETDKENPLDLFQIWLNLPRKNKLVESDYKMFWENDIPHIRENGVNIQVVAGNLKDKQALNPTPNSWAADTDNEIAIWSIELSANSQWQFPACSEGINRSLYFFQGNSISIAGQDINNHCILGLNNNTFDITSREEPVRLLLLQGRPINEPVVQSGPFVMNTASDIEQAIEEYSKNSFGGWPWPSNDHNHGTTKGRFARYPDGTEEIPER